jgi:hypothetical protein
MSNFHLGGQYPAQSGTKQNVGSASHSPQNFQLMPAMSLMNQFISNVSNVKPGLQQQPNTHDVYAAWKSSVYHQQNGSQMGFFGSNEAASSSNQNWVI